MRATTLPILWLLCIGSIPLSTARAASYETIDTAKSRIGFVSRQMGVPVSGQFRSFSGSIVFDTAHPEAGKLRIEVDLASIDAGSNEANDEVVGKDWFFVKRFPSAVFEAQDIKALGNGRYEVQGKLSLKGHGKPVLAKGTLRETPEGGIFEGGFTLKRLDFGIGEGLWGDPDTVADAVEVNCVLAVRPARPGGPAKKK